MEDITIRTHPFKALVTPTTRKLLVGTLPPEEVKFYFSNCKNTRLWDILFAISNNNNEVGKGGNDFDVNTKESILKKLEIGIGDIIHQYIRDEYSSTKDKHISPVTYNNLLGLIKFTNINELIFVYKNAFKWFLHSLENQEGVRLNKIGSKYSNNLPSEIKYDGKTIKLTLLPSPLNRGRKGETLKFKLDLYRKHILEI